MTGLKEQELSPEELKFLEEQEESVKEDWSGTITPEMRRKLMISKQSPLVNSLFAPGLERELTAEELKMIEIDAQVMKELQQVEDESWLKKGKGLTPEQRSLFMERRLFKPPLSPLMRSQSPDPK
jgi:hypothetical protein